MKPVFILNVILLLIISSFQAHGFIERPTFWYDDYTPKTGGRYMFFKNNTEIEFQVQAERRSQGKLYGYNPMEPISGSVGKKDSKAGSTTLDAGGIARYLGYPGAKISFRYRNSEGELVTDFINIPAASDDLLEISLDDFTVVLWWHKESFNWSETLTQSFQFITGVTKQGWLLIIEPPRKKAEEYTPPWKEQSKQQQNVKYEYHYQKEGCGPRGCAERL